MFLYGIKNVQNLAQIDQKHIKELNFIISHYIYYLYFCEIFNLFYSSLINFKTVKPFYFWLENRIWYFRFEITILE